MIIKSFTAESVTTALKLVRKEMGSAAVVLKTRQLPGSDSKSKVEITACLDKPTASQADHVLSERQAQRDTVDTLSPAPRLSADVFAGEAAAPKIGPVTEDRLAAIDRKLDQLVRMASSKNSTGTHHSAAVQNICSTLKDASIPESLVEALITKTLEKASDEDALAAEMRTQLSNELSSMMADTLEFKAGDRLLFMGPAGSGKTSLMGRTAAHLADTSQLSIRLATLDDCKIGAYDEIQDYAELLEVNLVDPLSTITSDHDTTGVLLVDSPALSRRTEELNTLAARIEELKPNYRFATFSALTRESDVEEFTRWIEPLAPTHLALTMLDLTDRWGSIVAACRITGLPLAFIVDSSGGKGAARKPSLEEITAKILGSGSSHE